MERKFLRFLLWTTIIVGAVLGLLRAFVIRTWRVPVEDLDLAASVAPTLEAGDLVILWRFTTPKFGELAVCEDPEVAGSLVIGRLLAEEGDRIVVTGDRVAINAERSGTESGCPNFTVVEPATGQELEQTCSIEAVGGHKHQVGGTMGHKNVPAPVEDTLADGEAYLVSDNRLLPYDSRTYGPVQRATCKESVVFRLMGPGGWQDGQRRLTAIY